MSDIKFCNKPVGLILNISGVFETIVWVSAILSIIIFVTLHLRNCSDASVTTGITLHYTFLIVRLIKN